MDKEITAIEFAKLLDNVNESFIDNIDNDINLLDFLLDKLNLCVAFCLNEEYIQINKLYLVMYENDKMFIDKNGIIKEPEEISKNSILKQKNKELEYWFLTSDIPHSTFKILNDENEVCSIGIVFNLNDLL